MIYVYDTVFKDTPVKTFKRYGITFKLEKKNVMGKSVYYSFVAPGMEKILVIPGFAEQYHEAEAKLKRAPHDVSLKDARRWIQRSFSPPVEEDEFPTEESDNGVVTVMKVEYRDITLTFEYLNNNLRLNTTFEIRDNNIFGNGIEVAMYTDVEES